MDNWSQRDLSAHAAARAPRPRVVDLSEPAVPADPLVPAGPAEPARPAGAVWPGVLAVHTPTPLRVVHVMPQPRVAGSTGSRPLPSPRRTPPAQRLARSDEPTP